MHLDRRPSLSHGAGPVNATYGNEAHLPPGHHATEGLLGRLIGVLQDVLQVREGRLAVQGAGDEQVPGLAGEQRVQSPNPLPPKVDLEHLQRRYGLTQNLGEGHDVFIVHEDL